MTPTEQDRRIAEEAAAKLSKYYAGHSLVTPAAREIILAAITEARKPLEEDTARLDWVIRNLNKRGFGDSVNGICSREDIDAARAQCPTNQTETPVASAISDGEEKKP